MASSVAESSFPLLCQINSQRRRNFVLGHRWKFARCVTATGSDSSGAASGDEKEDALQATIEKSKKIAERRKLVSSIKESTPNLDDAKPFAKEDENTTDATKKDKMDGDGNGSVSSSSYGKSSLNREPKAKPLTLNTTPLESSKLSSEKKKGITIATWEH